MTQLDQLKEQLFQKIMSNYVDAEGATRLEMKAEGKLTPKLHKRASEAIGLLMFIFSTNAKLEGEDKVLYELCNSVTALFDQEEAVYRELIDQLT